MHHVLIWAFGIILKSHFGRGLVIILISKGRFQILIGIPVKPVSQALPVLANLHKRNLVFRGIGNLLFQLKVSVQNLF